MIDRILNEEAYACYRFLIDNTNFKEGSSGYGLTLDRSSNRTMSSIAGSGFMLSALVIGVVNKWDDYQTNLLRARNTLVNFYENVPNYKGMFLHYLEFESGKRYKKSEYSTIDTTIFVNGMLTVDHFFKDDVIKEYTQKIFERIDWEHFIYELNGRKVFRMAYNDIIGGDYLEDNKLGWIHHWNMFSEQLTIYLLAAGSKLKPEVVKELFLGFERTVGGYGNYQFVYTPLGSLFVHQYTHAWFDFDKYYDLTGYDWFRNSNQAVLANYQYCQDHKEYQTFQKGFWGLSSCDGPKGYRGYGAPPFITYGSACEEMLKRTDGTVALYGIFASLPFAPEIVKQTVKKTLTLYPELKGDYGYFDSVNFENEMWIGRDYLSIDKGITLLMIDNYYRRTTWNNYTNHELIQKAIEKLAFKKKDEIWQQLKM
ncbi:MAG TPA: hypothetical protein GX692_02145 [Acholeplasmataceae bacterium]|nr:hypothetical protein [Acholeplasmataceae bacterium]